MYIPSINKFEDKQEIVAFMQRYSFATIVTVKDGIPLATHLPFLVKIKDNAVVLRSHFAKANPQAQDSVDTNVLVIFAEPHAYISPRHYEKAENVPTWNYIAVHAYGNYQLLASDEKKAELLKETILFFEADYLKQWDNLPGSFKSGMIKGITAFEIVVSDLQAKKKLSQNKTESEIDNIINELHDANNTIETDIAAYMKALKQ